MTYGIYIKILCFRRYFHFFVNKDLSEDIKKAFNRDLFINNREW